MITAFLDALTFRREQKRLNRSMRELVRNGMYSVDVHGYVTLRQKLYARFFGA